MPPVSPVEYSIPVQGQHEKKTSRNRCLGSRIFILVPNKLCHNFYQLSSEGCEVSGAEHHSLLSCNHIDNRKIVTFMWFIKCSGCLGLIVAATLPSLFLLFYQEKIKFYVAQYNLFCIIHKSCRCIY
mgnify:CR=1 FL=1